MPMMTNPDIINTTGHGRRQSDKISYRENLEAAHHKENYRSRAEHSERKAELNRLH